MSFAPSTPVTGGPQTGFTSPTYTIAADTAPDVNGKQYAVTALGGTQAGVTTHSVSSPFTGTFWKPRSWASLSKPNPITNLLANVPKNVWKLITRKGTTPLAGQPITPMVITTTYSVPAGSDTADPANIRAALSLHFGLEWAQSAGIGDSLITGVM